MNLLLSVGDWFAQNWMLLVLIVVAVALLVPSYLRNKKEVNARNELNNQIVKGTKIITTAGIYGTVESVEDTTDGKVVTIVTGNSNNPTTMTIHINAIGGIDNKTAVVVGSEELKEITDQKQSVELSEDVEEDNKKETKKTSSKKNSAKSKNKDENTLESE